MNRKDSKILFIGLDGATWRIMKPMFEQGRLPTLQRLCDTGASGVLKSIEPIVSPAIWTSIASGKTPEKHGVWDFVVASNNVRCKRIWDIATESNLKTGLCGYMVTWPPPMVDGFVIPGSFSRGPETHPDSLRVIRELDMSQRTDDQRTFFDLIKMAWQCNRLGARLNTFFDAALVKLKSKLNPDYLEKFYQLRRVGLDLYTDVFIEQTRRFQPNLAMYVFTFVDCICHNYWKFMEPERFSEVDEKAIAKHRTKIYQAYEAADRAIGRALKNLCDENTTVIVVSDHGFQSVPEAQGREADRTVRIKPETLIELLGWNVDAIRTFNIRGSTFFRSRGENQIDITQMQQQLEAITIVDSKQPLFEVSVDPFENIEIRVSESIGEFDDLKVTLASRIISANKIVEGDLGTISGDHHPDGIIIASGRGIQRNATIENASVLDVTPTLLALLGLPVGKDMDGRVLTELLHPDLVQRTPIHYIETWEKEDWTFEADAASASEELKAQLRSLGYL